MQTLTLWFREAPAVIPKKKYDIEYSVEQSESGDGVRLPSKLSQAILTDALNYLDLIKAEFHNQPKTYNLFLDVMKSYKRRILDTTEVIEHIAYLLEGRGALLQGFNLFLPPGDRIPLDFHSDPNFSWSARDMSMDPVDDSNGDEFNHS